MSEEIVKKILIQIDDLIERINNTGYCENMESYSLIAKNLSETYKNLEVAKDVKEILKNKNLSYCDIESINNPFVRFQYENTKKYTK